MKNLPDEKTIFKHGFTKITNKSIIQEDDSEFIEIPLKNIDSISGQIIFMKWLLIIGLAILFGGFVKFYINDEFSLIILFLVAIGLFFIFLFVYTSKKVITIKSQTETIHEEIKNSKEFLIELRKVIHAPTPSATSKIRN